jgi:hypothetical protein
MIKLETVGVGPTDALSLRVSVASLARVVFKNPEDGQTLLALERKATMLPAEGRVIVKAQPFGGALRIENLLPLKERIGDFHFDSLRSRSEMDFRLFIRPAAWGAVKDFSLEQFRGPVGSVLESGPDRELVEEFGDTLGVDLSPDQYQCNPLWTILENEPVPTENARAKSQPTVRIYRVFDVRITDSDLAKAMILNSHGNSDRELGEFAHENAREGRTGWANAMLVLPLEPLMLFYRSLPDEQRNMPAIYEGFHLGSSMTALLDGVLAPKYQRVGTDFSTFLQR